jgi:mRNA interferase MazF
LVRAGRGGAPQAQQLAQEGQGFVRNRPDSFPGLPLVGSPLRIITSDDTGTSAGSEDGQCRRRRLRDLSSRDFSPILRRRAKQPAPASWGPISLARMKTNTGAPTGTRSARINRGDVFWIGPDDSRGPVPSYSHPHVVVQDDVFNHSRIMTVVVCALTSNLQRANEPGNILLEVGEGNLPEQSVVVVSQVSSVDKSRLGERIGSLSDTRVEQILAGLRFQQRSFFGQ